MSKLSRMTVLVVVVLLSVSLFSSKMAMANKEELTKRPNKVLIAEDHVAQLMLLMDTTKNGRISKQDWMKFMEEEFDRLDKSRTGEVDLRQLPQNKSHASRFADVGK